MEAVPRLPMLSFDLKASHENAIFGPKLKQYIADFYREDPESYNNEIHQLEGLRSAAVRPALDLTGCAALKRYFCQLKSLQSRFPMNKGQPSAVTFAWKDLFANIVCTLADIRFEMVCVLYNIGALYCKLGASESRATPDSMKAACTHFQSAVWAFQHLRENYPQPSGIDLSPEVMKLFQDVCLAQAQECILEKSMQDNRKPSIVGAIGMQVLNYYKTALSALESPQSADIFQENVGSKTCSGWIKYLTFKISYTNFIVYIFQGMQSEEQQRMGERVAFFQAACDKLQEAKKLSKGMTPIDVINETLTYTYDVAETKRKAAKNENEFIYHEEVPDKDLLSEPKPASLAKGIPINFSDPEVSGPDIFSRLVPMGAHEASSMYSEEKAKLLRKILGAVDAKDSQLNDFMSSLQLDQLDALNQQESLPQDLVDRCASLSVRTDAIPTLIDTMNGLADIHTEVENMLADIRKIIQEEEANEKEYQQIMGTRPPSIVSTELSREANKYLEAHNKANESNQTLHKAMTLHLANLKVLILPIEEIETHVPSLQSVKGNIDNGAIGEMRALVAKVHEMQTQRIMFISMLREAVNADDITTQLLSRTGESLDDIFKKEIEKHNKQVALIEQNMLAQENILKALTDAYAKYASTRKLISDVLRKRDASIMALITSYDTYEDLLNKSLKGLEFYRKLSSNVSKLLTRVKSTCKVQEEERTQLLSNNTSKQALASSKLSSTEGPISHQVPNSRDIVATGPKLKDFLPYMKNRTSTSHRSAPEALEPYVGQMYPPYVRPAPVGSEGTSESSTKNYQDPSAAVQNTYQNISEPYKGYQYIQQATGQYTAHQYPDQTHAYQYGMYDNSQSKPDVGMSQNINYPHFQQYNSVNISDNSESSPKTSNPVDKFSTLQDSTVSNQHSIVPPYSQYNPSIQFPSIVNSSLTYGAYGNNQTSNQPHVVQNVPSNQQYMTYPDCNQTFKTEPSTSDDQISMGSVSHQMQNMNISYSTPSVNTSYPSSTLSYSNDLQNFDVSNQVGNRNTQIMYSAENLQAFASANNIYPGNSNSSLSSSVGSYNTVSTSQAVVTPTSINNPDTTGQNYGYQSSYSVYQNPPSVLQSNISTIPQNYSPMPSDNSSSSHVSTATYSDYSAYPTPSLQISDSHSYITKSSTDVLENKVDLNDRPIKSHVQYQFMRQGVNTDVSQQYSPNNMYNSNISLPDAQNITSTNPQHLNSMQPVDSNTSLSVQVNTQNLSGQQTPMQSIDSNLAAINVASHPSQIGYTYNAHTGTYVPSESYNMQSGTYNTQVGSFNIQNVTYDYQSMPNSMQNVQLSNYGSNDNSSQNLFTNAGTYGTVYTSSGNFASTGTGQNLNSNDPNNVQYYSLPYGHQNVGYSENTSNTSDQQYSQVFTSSSDLTHISNQSTITYVSSNDSKTSTTDSIQGNGIKSSPSVDEPVEPKVEHEEIKNVSAIDLLSGLDFTIEHAPLVPEIKVPPVSEHVIRKVLEESKKVNSDMTNNMIDSSLSKIVENPPKRDIFSEPNLLNKFTQEVKSLQLFVDGFTKKTHSGITMLDSKWKKIQDSLAKENATKSTKCAKDNLGKNASPDVLPFDDTRIVLRLDSDDNYINASHVQQISPWSIPMIVSDMPIEENYSKFWHMIYQERVSIIVCLLTEIELQGKFYGPMAKNQKLEFTSELSVSLIDLECNVNWTRRHIVVYYKNVQHKITHYQINVFPARIVSAPLVLLVDQVLRIQNENAEKDQFSKTLIHCSTGAGRSSLIVLLTMVMCEVRAGYVNLKDLLESGFLYLGGTRTNVLEDTKYLVDVYRTVLFYIQGVLCSGTVMFNGEAVSVPSGASVPPPHIPMATSVRRPSAENFNKFSKESFEEMKQAAGLKSGDMKDPLSYLDPLWSLKKRKD